MAGLSPDAAREMLFGQALVPLGTAVSPVGPAGRRETAPGRPAVEVFFAPPGEPPRELMVAWGELRILSLPPGCRARLILTPATPGTDVGAGPGEPWNGMAAGGAVGLIIDARGRARDGFPAAATAWLAAVGA